MRLAVWDVDGTLVDSREIILECCQHTLRQADLPEPDYEAVRQIVGLSLGEAFSILAPSLGPEAVEAYKTRFRAHRARPGFKEPLYEGAQDALFAARPRAGPWPSPPARAAGAWRRSCRCTAGAELFDSTHCADDGPGKPDPAMLLAAMAASGARAEETVMIGDTAHDMRMALAAGVRAQGVDWGFNTAAELRAAGANHVASDFVILNSELDAFSNVPI